MQGAAIPLCPAAAADVKLARQMEPGPADMCRQSGLVPGPRGVPSQSSTSYQTPASQLRHYSSCLHPPVLTIVYHEIASEAAYQPSNGN